ncbi:MAG: GAF domain-containing protein [Desulfuromonadales bacterium]|nr:GAF domain-containing protein [Desulfuromonadales bacterium]
MHPDCDPVILEHFLAGQAGFHNMATDSLLAEVFCVVVTDLPGVVASALYLDNQRLAQCAGDGLHADWPATTTEPVRACIISEDRRSAAFPLQTIDNLLGDLHLTLSDLDRFLPYRPHLETALARIALLIENRQLKKEVQRLNEGVAHEVREQTAEVVAREKRFRTLAEKASVVPWEFSFREMRFTYVGPQIVELFGDPVESWNDFDSWARRIHPDDRQDAVRSCQIESAAGRDHDFYYRALRRDGQILWIHDIVTVVQGENGPDKLLGYFIDVTERFRRNALQAARLRLNDYALEHSTRELMTRFLDEAESLTTSEIGFFHFVEGDQNALSLQAWSSNTRNQMCRTPATAGTHYPISRAGIWADCIRHAAPVVHNDYTSEPNRKGLPEGHAPVVRQLAVPILRGGRVVAALGVGNKKTVYTDDDAELLSQLADIAWETIERKKVETALRTSEQRFRNMFLKHDAIMLIIDPHRMTIVEGNEAAATFYGYSPDKLIGMPLAQIDTAPEEEIAAACQSALVCENNCMDQRQRLKSGETRDVEVHVTPIGHKGQAMLFAIVFDVTDRNRLLSEYRRSSQLAALGTVAAGVAHEINNPLQGMMNYATLIALKPAQAERVEKFARQIVHQGERISEITRTLLHYSRDDRGQFVDSDICQLIRATIRLLKTNMKKEPVSLTVSLPDQPVTMVVLPQGIQQIVSNLVGNARDALTEKEAETTDKRIDVRGSVEAATVSEPQRFVLEVIDNGVGIPAQNLARVGDAFFTTKRNNRGTGLGLAIVGDIVKKHRGSIAIDSKVGGYTKVTVVIPFSQ